MCALSKPILEKVYRKLDLLMCVLRAHINWTLYLIPLNKYNYTIGLINKLYSKALMISFDPSMKYP